MPRPVSPLTPAERRLRAQAAAHTSWSRTPSRTARTQKARAAFIEQFEQEVDPDGSLDPAERTLRAVSARKAHYARLALKSAAARRRSRELAAEAAEADAALAAAFDAPQITTDADGRHWDAADREYTAVDIDGELTFRAVTR